MSNNEPIRIKLPAYLKMIAVLLGIILIVFIMIEAKSVLVPLIIAGFLAILIAPFTSWMERKRVPKVLACIISLIGLLVILTSIIYFFYNQIIGFANDLAGLERRFGELIGRFNYFITDNFDGAVPISVDNIRDVVFQQFTDNINTLTQGVIATAGTITMLFILPVYVFLFLFYRNFLIEFIRKAFNNQYEDKVNHGILKVKSVVQNYIKGAFIVICILAVLNSIALYSLGIKHAFLFAVFAAFLNVIPFLGPFLGATFPILFALLTKDSLWYPFGVFLAFYVIQLFESNLFTPKIVGSKVSMNPLMTIIALFVGNFIWGLAGMILFIPGIAILKVVFDEIEGMEPYGFLLGAVKTKKSEGLENPTAKKVINKIKNIGKS